MEKKLQTGQTPDEVVRLIGKPDEEQIGIPRRAADGSWERIRTQDAIQPRSFIYREGRPPGATTTLMVSFIGDRLLRKHLMHLPEMDLNAPRGD